MRSVRCGVARLLHKSFLHCHSHSYNYTATLIVTQRNRKQRSRRETRERDGEHLVTAVFLLQLIRILSVKYMSDRSNDDVEVLFCHADELVSCTSPSYYYGLSPRLTAFEKTNLQLAPIASCRLQRLHCCEEEERREEVRRALQGQRERGSESGSDRELPMWCVFPSSVVAVRERSCRKCPVLQ